MAAADSLTHARASELLDYDPLTGVLTWRTDRPGGKRAGSEAGGRNGDSYILIGIDRRQFYAHRLAWFIRTGMWPRTGIDHKDGVHDHNWWTNLREATKSQNGQNIRKAPSNSKSGVLGVCWVSRLRRWMAQINLDGQHFFLGYFLSIDDASAAYQSAKERLHPFRPM